jgi:hypothetical protein
LKAKSDTEQAPAVSRISPVTLWRAVVVRKDEELDAADAASTLFRLFRSKHVRDLKLIFHVAFIVLIFCAVIAACWFIGGVVSALFQHHAPSAAAHTADAIAPSGANGAADSKGPPTGIAFLSSIATVSCAIMAWAYLTAGKRLGVVDLFACEIATLCRVGTIFNVGEQRVETWKRIDGRNAIDPPVRSIRNHRQQSPRSGNYVSQEDYFPIFDHNSQDLQTLEALVVGHITEFYTYMKATRDSQRKLAQAPTVEEAKEAAANIVYMLFLGYESARKAIADLVEFQPTRAENTIVILLTELFCYSFLCEHFKYDDLRFKRLELRETDYEAVVSDLREVVEKSYKRAVIEDSYKANKKYWAPAKETVPEMDRLYDQALKTLKSSRELRSTPSTRPTKRTQTPPKAA